MIKVSKLYSILESDGHYGEKQKAQNLNRENSVCVRVRVCVCVCVCVRAHSQINDCSFINK